MNMAVLSAAASSNACQQPIGNALAPSSAVTHGPTILDTAESLAPGELTIIAPANTLLGNNTLIQVAENSDHVIQVKAQDVSDSQFVYRLQDGEDIDKL